MKVTPSLMPLVSTKTTPTPCALAWSTIGASAFGSVGAMAMASMPLASWSSTWLICVCTSLSTGGDSTTRSTPSSAALSLAPCSTAAQNGLPAPGPFMLKSTVSACALITVPARRPAANPRTFFMSSSCFFSRLLTKGAGAGDRATGPVLPPRRSAAPQHVDIDGQDDHHADQHLLPEHTDIVEI